MGWLPSALSADDSYDILVLRHIQWRTVYSLRYATITLLAFEQWLDVKQLAHADRDEVRSTYTGARWISDHPKMFEWWSDYLDRAEAGKEQS